MNESPKWVTLKKFSERSGVTAKSFYAMMTKGKLQLAREYVVKNRRIYVNLEAFDRWIERN